jgi:hypothetical protein
MTSKTQQLQLEAKTETPPDDLMPPGETGVTGASLQQTLGEIGEELARQEQATASAFQQLHKRLESLSRQLESNEKQVADRLAQANRAAEEANRQKEALLAQAAAAGADGEAVPLGEAVGKAAGDAPSAGGTGAAETPPAETPSAKAPAEAAPTQPQKVAEPVVASSPPPHAAMPPHLAASGAAVPTGQPVEASPPTARPMPARAVPAAAPASPAANNYAWERAILGDELAAEPMLAAERAELVDALLSGDETAAALVGWLLIFAAAPSDRVPQLLRDVGEAYYAWRPHTGGDSFRNALIEYIRGRCEAAGVGNKIELVQPGDRFDQSRHISKQRGIEVEDVHGWVVLRDNGKVYTKASVTTK